MARVSLPRAVFGVGTILRLERVLNMKGDSCFITIRTGIPSNEGCQGTDPSALFSRLASRSPSAPTDRPPRLCPRERLFAQIPGSIRILNIMFAGQDPFPPESITREQAVVAYTLTAAYAEFEDSRAMGRHEYIAFRTQVHAGDWSASKTLCKNRAISSELIRNRFFPSSHNL